MVQFGRQKIFWIIKRIVQLKLIQWLKYGWDRIYFKFNSNRFVAHIRTSSSDIFVTEEVLISYEGYAYTKVDRRHIFVFSETFTAWAKEHIKGYKVETRQTSNTLKIEFYSDIFFVQRKDFMAFVLRWM